jgi:hypothetical protein
MSTGWLKRIGLILVALAFLGGGMPGRLMFNFAVAPAAAMSPGMGGAHAITHPERDCGEPGTKAPACQHAGDCLACLAFDVPVRVGPVAALHWTRLAFHPSTPALSGVSPPLELFPPIRQS